MWRFFLEHCPPSPKSETTWTTGLPLPVYSYIQDQCILKGHNVLRPLSDGNTPLGLHKYCPLIWLHCSDKYPTWYGWISEVLQVILGAVYWHPSNGWHTLQVVCGIPQPNMGIFQWSLCQKPRLNEERLFPKKKKKTGLHVNQCPNETKQDKWLLGGSNGWENDG